MEDLASSLFKFAGLLTTIGLCGAAFSCGFVGMCKFFGWKPISTNITIYNHPMDE